MGIVLLFNLLGRITIFVLITIFIVNAIHRMEHRADERLKIYKENIELKQKQIQEINNRLANIEIMLKEVD